jgi:hypothetical protein
MKNKIMPFFPFYGTKNKIVNNQYYPEPKFDSIIEPFAGAACYSCFHWQKNVTLIEKDPRIYALWSYLLRASPKDILGLPIPRHNQTTDDFHLSQPETDLVGYHLARGAIRPSHKPSKQRNAWNKERRKLLADSLFHIKHWKVILGDYSLAKNKKATWFVDPPYQNGGHKYRCDNGSIDFPKLKDWIFSRNGQVIACENTSCNWIPVEPLCKHRGNLFTTTEAVLILENGEVEKMVA